VISSSQSGGGSESPPPWETVDPAPRRRFRFPRSTGWPVALALIAAFWLGGFAVDNLRTTRYSGAVTRLFPTIGGSNIDENSVNAAWDIVRNEYVVRDVDAAKATAGAESGIVQYLHDTYGDRFTAYFSADQYKSLQDNLSGRRNASVGIELQARCAGGAICAGSEQPSVVAIVSVLRNQPAEKGGVQRGDILVSVDGTKLGTLAPDPATQITDSQPIIDKPAGTQHTFVVQRGTQTLSLQVTDEDLSIPSVWSMRFGSVVDIQVTGFDDNTGKDVKQQLQDALNSGATGVVLDLRHNPGGFVTEAQETASQFLKKSSTVQDVVVRRGRLDNTQGPGSAQQVTHDTVTDDGGIAVTQPMAVLVDGDSASAAEIVAAALHDYKRATLVGDKTFGKGSVQEDFSLPDGADLHLTVQKWFGPAGESIDGNGISPDKAVALPDQDHRFRLDAQSGDASGDAQLQAAIAVAQGH
jgi:carboxyl-terminal processing protease